MQQFVVEAFISAKFKHAWQQEKEQRPAWIAALVRMGVPRLLSSTFGVDESKLISCKRGTTAPANYRLTVSGGAGAIPGSSAPCPGKYPGASQAGAAQAGAAHAGAAHGSAQAAGAAQGSAQTGTCLQTTLGTQRVLVTMTCRGITFVRVTYLVSHTVRGTQ